MPRFLIEVPHEAERSACIRAVQVFLDTGSHFLTNADWGCLDGDHRAWIVLDAADKREARAIVPPGFREAATIVQLNRFTPDDLDQMRDSHQG